MIASLLFVAGLSIAPPPLKILFVGNSHTGNGRVPQQVESLMESDGSGRDVVTGEYVGDVLNNQVENPNLLDDISSGKWNIIVLQGAMISSSHKYTYPQDGAIRLANAGLKAKAKVYFFAEWPRRGWDETEYILDVYRGIVKKTPGAQIIPVCRSWDIALKAQPKLNLWASDGNHSSVEGAFMAANCIYYKLVGGEKRNPRWVNNALKPADCEVLRGYARRAILPAN